MRNRNYILKNLERLETKLTNLQFIVKRGESLDTYQQNLSQAMDLLELAKSAVEREPFDGNEMKYRSN